MKLTWKTIHGELCGVLPSEPANVLAHVWHGDGAWRMGCAFGDFESQAYGSPEAAQQHAQEMMDAWVQRHTLGWLVDPEAASIGSQLIDNERMRQIHEEEWTPAHDDGHTRCELTAAAHCYIEEAAQQSMGGHTRGDYPEAWPWGGGWKPSDDPIRNLTKAGALIAAEIDRLMRAKGGSDS